MFLDLPIPMAQVLRLYILMFPNNGLYVCIIFETACHRTTFKIFCNITQNTTSEENNQKMSHISSPIVLFSYGKVKDVLWDKDQISSGVGKRKGKRRYGERSPK